MFGVKMNNNPIERFIHLFKKELYLNVDEKRQKMMHDASIKTQNIVSNSLL